jgi:hypothetical protein
MSIGTLMFEMIVAKMSGQHSTEQIKNAVQTCLCCICDYDMLQVELDFSWICQCHCGENTCIVGVLTLRNQILKVPKIDENEYSHELI